LDVLGTVQIDTGDILVSVMSDLTIASHNDTSTMTSVWSNISFATGVVAKAVTSAGTSFAGNSTTYGSDCAALSVHVQNVADISNVTASSCDNGQIVIPAAAIASYSGTGGCADSETNSEHSNNIDGKTWVDYFFGLTCANFPSWNCGDQYTSEWKGGLTANQACCACKWEVRQGVSKPCLQQGLILSAAAMTGTSYLLSCDYLDTIALDLNNNICDGMVKGLIDTCIGQAFIGFFYFFVVAVGCMGMNRFNADNYSDNPARVAPEQGPQGQNNQDPAATFPQGETQKVDETQGQYSAEQAMAATRIQSKQRQKQACRKVETQRSAKANQGTMYQ